MPFTLVNSSAVKNGPLASLYSMMANAFFGPTPFRLSASSSALAVFILTGS